MTEKLKICSKCQQLPVNAAGRYWCQPCVNKYQNERRRGHPQDRKYRLKRKYGISAIEADRMLIAQSHMCAACNRNLMGAPPMMIHIDHCHSTGKVRGILCGPCNRILGMAKDNATTLTSLAAYISRFSS